MQRVRKLQDGVDPVAEAADALHLVQHGAVAEDKLFHFRVGPSEEDEEEQKNSFHFNLPQYFVRCHYAKPRVPIRQAEDEEFDEGRFQQQLLVFGAEVAETGDVLRPLSYHLHGGRQQVVELPDVVGVFFLSWADFRLVVLSCRKPEFRKKNGQNTNSSKCVCLLTLE